MNLQELLIQLGDKTVLIDYEDYPIDNLTVADVTRDGLGSSITEEIYNEIKIHISESKEISKEAFLVAIVTSSIKNDNLIRSEIFKQLNSANGLTIRESFSNILKWPTSPLHFEDIAPFLNYNADSFYQSGIRHSAMLLLGKVTEKDKAFKVLKSLYSETKTDRERESVILVLTSIGNESSIQFSKNIVKDPKILSYFEAIKTPIIVSQILKGQELSNLEQKWVDKNIKLNPQ